MSVDGSPQFPSRRDGWLTAVIWIAALGCVLAGIAQLESALAPIPKALLLLALLASAGFMLWILYGTSYHFAGDTLHIRSGPFRFRVPLVEVESVEPSRNPLSSPACSLDRLLIRYRAGHGRILVSPEDKAGFLQTLVARGSHLVLERDRVRRVQDA